MYLCDTDRVLVEVIADLWVESGGDALGFDMVSANIRQAILEREVDHED